MTLAYTMASGRGDNDLLLAEVARALQAEGVRPCGIVQINTENPGARRCDMDVQVLPDGPILRISQSLGKEARGCRLDSAALEAAAGYAKTELERGADLLIVNKFGKQEAAGSGFREIISEAFFREIPVLVGLNALNRAAFDEFAGGLAVCLPADDTYLLAWARDALAAAPKAA